MFTDTETLTFGSNIEHLQYPSTSKCPILNIPINTKCEAISMKFCQGNHLSVKTLWCKNGLIGMFTF